MSWQQIPNPYLPLSRLVSSQVYLHKAVTQGHKSSSPALIRPEVQEKENANPNLTATNSTRSCTQCFTKFLYAAYRRTVRSEASGLTGSTGSRAQARPRAHGHTDTRAHGHTPPPHGHTIREVIGEPIIGAPTQKSKFSYEKEIRLWKKKFSYKTIIYYEKRVRLHKRKFHYKKEI